MTHTEIAAMLATALRAAILAAAEPNEMLAGAYVDAGINALMGAQTAADGTALAAAVRREARGEVDWRAAVYGCGEAFDRVGGSYGFQYW